MVLITRDNFKAERKERLSPLSLDTHAGMAEVSCRLAAGVIS